mgnify:CR=1 FL=1
MEKRHGLLKVWDGLDVPVEFVVNEREKCIAAVARDCSGLAYAAIDSDKYFRSVSCIEIQEGSKLDKDLWLKDTYSAVARCVEPDVFDVDKGIEIASEKLFVKLSNAILNRKILLAKEFLRIADRLVGKV